MFAVLDFGGKGMAVAMATPECAQARQDNELLNDISCPECEPGQHDHDSDPSTPCIWCGAGQVSWRPGTGGPTAQQALAGLDRARLVEEHRL